MSTIAVVYLFGAFQGLALVSVLTSKNRKEINAKTWLIFFIALDVGFLLYQIAVFERYIELYPHLIGIHLPFLFLLPPLFYLYIQFESDPKPWKYVHSAHFIPAFLALIVMLPYYFYTPHEKLERLFGDFHTRSIYPFRGELGMALLLSGTIYALLAIKLARKNTSRNAPWIRLFTIGFAVLILCLGISYYLMNTHLLPHRLTISTGIITFSFFIHFIGYAALMEPSLFHSSGSKRVLSFSDPQIKNRIIDILVEQQRFTQAGFGLKDLSNLMSTNENYLSRYINQEFGCNFPFLINSYRIAEAKSMIQSSAHDHLNFLGIAMAVGFANKNSFTRAFKRHTGQTPSEFRENFRSKEIQFMK